MSAFYRVKGENMETVSDWQMLYEDGVLEAGETL